METAGGRNSRMTAVQLGTPFSPSGKQGLQLRLRR
jgi:hypothetical protein